MMGAVFTEAEIRELIARMNVMRENAAAGNPLYSLAASHCADMLKELLEEHGL